MFTGAAAMGRGWPYLGALLLALAVVAASPEAESSKINGLVGFVLQNLTIGDRFPACRGRTERNLRTDGRATGRRQAASVERRAVEFRLNALKRSGARSAHGGALRPS